MEYFLLSQLPIPSFTDINDPIIVPTSTSTSTSTSAYKLNWFNNTNRGYFFQSSTDKFNDILYKYRTLNNIDTNINGEAHWYRKDFYEKIELCDRLLINKWPKPHNNILSIYVSCDITRDTWFHI